MEKPRWQRIFDERLREFESVEAVYDIGGGAQPAERARFKKCVLVDNCEKYGPDLVADVQKLPFEDGSIEAVLCLEVLEHVENPFAAVSELHRVLKPGGRLIASVPFFWPHHPAPGYYKDFWRFTPEGLKELFKAFAQVEIVRKGGWVSALINFIPSFTRLDRLFRPFGFWIDDRVTFGRATTPGHFIFLRK